MRIWSASRLTSNRSSAAPGPRSESSIGAPNCTNHLLGSGSKPAGPSHGNVGVTGNPRDADVLREPRHLAEHRRGFFGADDRDRNDRRVRAQRELDEAAAAEPLQAVAIFPQLAHPLFAFGEHGDQLAVLEQALGVRRIGAHAADAVHDRAEPRQVKHGVFDERADVAARRMVAANRVHHHRAVVRQRAGVVGDEQRTAVRGHVLEPGRLHAEPPRVQELEQPLPARGRAWIAAEIVDDVAAPPHRERAPAPPHALERQPLAQIDRERRRALLLEAALELAELGVVLGRRELARHVAAVADFRNRWRVVVAEEAEIARAFGPRAGVGHARPSLTGGAAPVARGSASPNQSSSPSPTTGSSSSVIRQSPSRHRSRRPRARRPRSPRSCA